MSLAASAPLPAAPEAPCPGARLDLVLLGPGLVGRRFLVQLQRQQARLAPRGIELRLVAVANSRRMLVDPTGLDPREAAETLATQGEPLDRDHLLALGGRGPAVLVDCTGAEAVAEAYEAFAEAGFHLVGASKLLNAGPLGRYRLRATLGSGPALPLRDLNVGAGLPRDRHPTGPAGRRRRP